MNLEQYIERLKEMDPDVLVDELELSSEEIVGKFHTKALSIYYRNEYAEEPDEDGDD